MPTQLFADDALAVADQRVAPVVVVAAIAWRERGILVDRHEVPVQVERTGHDFGGKSEVEGGGEGAAVRIADGRAVNDARHRAPVAERRRTGAVAVERRRDLCQ